MQILLTARKLKPGSYEAWRKAWEPEEWPKGASKAYILRNTHDPDEIVAFGMFEGSLDDVLADPRMEEVQRKRLDAMAPHIASTGADGVYEVVEVVTPPS